VGRGDNDVRSIYGEAGAAAATGGRCGGGGQTQRVELAHPRTPELTGFGMTTSHANNQNSPQLCCRPAPQAPNNQLESAVGTSSSLQPSMLCRVTISVLESKVISLGMLVGTSRCHQSSNHLQTQLPRTPIYLHLHHHHHHHHRLVPFLPLAIRPTHADVNQVEEIRQRPMVLRTRRTLRLTLVLKLQNLMLG
jgi:hypothetical protein